MEAVALLQQLTVLAFDIFFIFTGAHPYNYIDHLVLSMSFHSAYILTVNYKIVYSSMVTAHAALILIIILLLQATARRDVLAFVCAPELVHLHLLQGLDEV